MMRLVGVLILLAVAQSAFGSTLGDEWRAISDQTEQKWMAYFNTSPNINPALEMSVFRGSNSLQSAHAAALWYAENCLSLCHLGENNFCAATQSCLMSGFWDGKGLDDCTNEDCVGVTLCNNIDPGTIGTCNTAAKELASFFNTIDTQMQAQQQAQQQANSQGGGNQGGPSDLQSGALSDDLSDDVLKKVAMFGHGILGCWRSAQPAWSLTDYIVNMASYAETVDIEDSVTGVAEMFNKLSEQSLVWEWTSAFTTSKCNPQTKAAYPMEQQQTVVCEGRKDLPGGMTTESAADEKFCFFPGRYDVPGCTQSCNFDNVAECLSAMFDDTHSCQSGGKCCFAEQGPAPQGGSAQGRPQGASVDDVLSADILDLAEPRTFREIQLEFGGGVCW